MKVQSVLANRNSAADFIENAFNNLTSSSCGVYAATAFFTDADTVEEMTKRGCSVKLVVRLGFPTSPTALRQVLRNSKVQVRFVTSTSFHPKMYIFGEHGAIVGSANLTKAALRTNQEVAVFLERADSRFDELMGIFYSYWSGSKPLTEEIIDQYEKICGQFDTDVEEKLHRDVKAAIGDVRIQNITVVGNKKSSREIFTDDYEKSYQEFLNYFGTLESIYKSVERRKEPESKIPLRFEIDSFISFVRHEKAPLETWQNTPIMHGKEQADFIRPLVLEWMDYDYKWFTESIVPINYPLIRDTLGAPAKISAATDDELFDALNTCHSFHDQLHRVRGGLAGLKQTFFEKNDGDHIRETISYLIHGDEPYIQRMAKCIFVPEYKLARFGRSVVQELTAWVSREELPVCNGRTTKVLRYLGFDIQQVDEMG